SRARGEGGGRGQARRAGADDLEKRGGECQHADEVPQRHAPRRQGLELEPLPQRPEQDLAQARLSQRVAATQRGARSLHAPCWVVATRVEKSGSTSPPSMQSVSVYAL